MPIPSDYSLLANLDELQRDIAFARALRRTRFITRGGEISFQSAPGADNVSLDLRSLSASGAAAAGDIPDVTGHPRAVLTTNGGTTSWFDVHAETLTWLSRVCAAGGTLTAHSLSIAENIAAGLAGASYNSKIVYLLPLLGGNLAAARTPLRDSLSVGRAINTNFTEADFSEATGLQGGSGKTWELPIKPSQLGTSSNGGLGYVAASLNFTGSPPQTNALMGLSVVQDFNNQFMLVATSTTSDFRWEDGIDRRALDSTAPVAGNYYGQRSSATLRELYRDGALLATNTTSDSAPNTNAFNIILNGQNNGGLRMWNGSRCACAYLTTGTLTSTEVADLHTLLQTYLITPTGR